MLLTWLALGYLIVQDEAVTKDPDARRGRVTLVGPDWVFPWRLTLRLWELKPHVWVEARRFYPQCSAITRKLYTDPISGYKKRYRYRMAWKISRYSRDQNQSFWKTAPVRCL